MEYLYFLNDYVDDKSLSAMKSLVTICRKFEPITLSFPLPSEEDGVEIHYYSAFEDELCIGVLAICLFPFDDYDGTSKFTYEITAFVHPDYRKQGIFKTLYHKFLETENIPQRSNRVLFLSDRHCTSAIFVAIEFGMKQLNAEYLMQMDLTKPDTKPNTKSTSSLTIKKCRNRRILARHYALLFDMSTSIGKNYVDTTLDDNNNISPFLIRLNDTPIGSGYFMYASPQKAYLFSFGILPEFQNRGLGLASLLELKNFVPKTCEKITVQVSGQNIPACRLYEKAGFTLTQQLLFYGWE